MSITDPNKLITIDTIKNILNNDSYIYNNGFDAAWDIYIKEYKKITDNNKAVTYALYLDFENQIPYIGWGSWDPNISLIKPSTLALPSNTKCLTRKQVIPLNYNVVFKYDPKPDEFEGPYAIGVNIVKNGSSIDNYKDASSGYNLDADENPQISYLNETSPSTWTVSDEGFALFSSAHADIDSGSIWDTWYSYDTSLSGGWQNTHNPPGEMYLNFDIYDGEGNYIGNNCCGFECGGWSFSTAEGNGPYTIKLYGEIN